MSQENVEVVRRAFEAWTHGDTETFLTCLDPAVELQSAVIGGAEGNTYRGHQGVREWLAESDAAFQELRVEREEYRDAGDRVLILCHMYARWEQSAVELGAPLAWLCTLRNGKIARQQGYLDVREALEAVGLAE